MIRTDEIRSRTDILLKQHSIETGRGPYKKGQETRAKIIRSAIDLLTEDGYQSFSLRKVALRAGVSIGNLQHHFPSKESLTAIMLDDVISGYLEEFEALLRSTESPRDQLRSIVYRVIEDLGTKETTMFFPELWSMANHDAAVSKYMHDMYGRYRDIYKAVIPAINPALTDKQVERAALFFAASLEGHTMFVGFGKNDNFQLEFIADIAYQSFLRIIESADIPE